jgi:hypothetical protein
VYFTLLAIPKMTTLPIASEKSAKDSSKDKRSPIDYVPEYSYIISINSSFT